jgi:hypothetical protein
VLDSWVPGREAHTIEGEED